MTNKNFLDHVNDKQKPSEEKESFQKETFVQYDKKRKIPLPLIVFVFICILLIAMFLNQSIEVLDLENLTLDEATLWAEKQGITLSSIEVFSESEEFRVVSQSVAAGEKIKSGDLIKVEISKGLDPYEMLTLPEFDETWSRNSIQNWLASNGVKNFTFVEEVNDVIAEDFLIRFRLIGTSENNFLRNSEIEFTLTQVVNSSSIEIPDFMNNDLTTLDSWAVSEGILYHYTVEENALYSEGKIFYQSVLPGQNMSRSDTFEVKVSNGQGYEAVEMINLINMSISNAEAWLKNNRVLYKKDYVYSSVYPENTVVDQSVYEGTSVDSQDVVIKVSIGEGIQVDDFSDLTLVEAQFIANQFNNIEVLETYTDLIKDSFVSQSIPAGSFIDSSDYVQVLYSKGHAIMVPDFRNQTVYDLESWLNEQNEMGAQLTYSIQMVENNNLDSGEIIRQNILNGNLSIGGSIMIDVSSGLSIPDFSNMSKAETINFGNQSMINVNVQEAYSLEVEKDGLISQSIEPGVKGDQHTIIDVVYSLGQELPIPNFIGMVLTDVDSWIRDENDLGASLKLEIHEQFSSSIPYGDIISQNIYNVYKEIDTELKVIVSKGVSYTVPNWSYYTVESIELNAIANHVNVVFQVVSDSSFDSGRVISQSPDPGTVISKQDFITIQVAE